MKKTIQFQSIGFLILLGLFSITASAQPKTTKIQFEQTDYDFGEIQEGTKVTHVYTFTNTGDEPLILSEARGSCGCTVPQWPRDPIFPGETASLTVEFNSKNKSGKRNQKVTITANTNPPQSFLYLLGTVVNENGDAGSIIDIESEQPTVKEPENCFTIYPNPTAEILKLQMNDYNGKDALISIYSDQGQLMAARTVKAEKGTIEFNVSHFPSGVYYAKVMIAGLPQESKCFMVME